MLRPFTPQKTPPTEDQLGLIRAIVNEQMGTTSIPGSPYPHPSVQTPSGIAQQITQSGKGLYADPPDPPPGVFKGRSYNPGNPRGEFAPTEDYANQQSKPGVMDYLRGIPGGVQETVGRAMDDPTRRAMIAFGAAMMDTSHRFGEGLSYGTQMSRAVQSGLDEYARATKTKAPKVTVRKFDREGVRWGEIGHWGTDSQGQSAFTAYDKPYRMDKEEAETEKGPKRAAPNQKDFTGPSWKIYLKTKDPSDLVLKKTTSAFMAKPNQKDYTKPTWAKYLKTKDLADLRLRPGVTSPYKKGHLQSYVEEGKTRTREWDGEKFVPFKAGPRWQTQAGSRKYTMPDGGELSLPEILSLYKANNPAEAGGLAGFAMAINDPENAAKWMFGEEGKGSFGRWLDKIEFDASQFDYLEGRAPTGAGGAPAPEYKPGMQLEHGKYYNTPKGVMRYNEKDDTFYPKKDWGNKQLWSIR